MDVLKRLHHSAAAPISGSALAELYIRLVYRTSRVLREPAEIEAKLFAQHSAGELSAARQAVENGLNPVTRRAYALAGGRDPLPRRQAA